MHQSIKLWDLLAKQKTKVGSPLYQNIKLCDLSAKKKVTVGGPCAKIFNCETYHLIKNENRSPHTIENKIMRPVSSTTKLRTGAPVNQNVTIVKPVIQTKNENEAIMYKSIKLWDPLIEKKRKAPMHQEIKCWAPLAKQKNKTRGIHTQENKTTKPADKTNHINRTLPVH